MKELMNYVICSGLEIPIDQDIIPKVMDTIPDSCFGVFVTARRTHEFYESYNRKIKHHGCQGYWDINFLELSKDEILSKIQTASINTTSNDNRKNRFKKEIQQDIRANYEINFMIGSPTIIDVKTGRLETGEIFNNADYGVLFIGDENKRATFLPRVWINKCWAELKTKLRTKAGSETEGKFYAYKTISYKDGISSILDQSYLKFLTQGFIKYIEENYQDVVPYQRNSENITTTNINKSVRNLLTTHVILRSQHNITQKTADKIKSDLEYYYQLFDLNNKSMRYAGSVLAMSLKGIGAGGVDDICAYLYDHVDENWSVLERKFELGKTMLSLSECCPRMNSLLSVEQKMYKQIGSESGNNKADIFQCNWHAQYLHSLNTNHNEMCADHAKLLLNKTINIIDNFGKDPELNYVVVALETLASLYSLMSYETDKIKLLNYLLYVFCAANKKHYKDGLYCFKNGDARIDLTTHAINSYTTMTENMNIPYDLIGSGSYLKVKLQLTKPGHYCSGRKIP